MAPSRRLLTLAWVLSLAVVPASTAGAASAAASAALTIRGDAPYQLFDGIGGMSSGGTSRLLLDYPPQQQSEILDLLFLPQFGMSSSILKLEVGGDSQSTDGTEAAFKHYREEPAQCGNARGYEGWLLGEALKRNADIRSYLLSWAMPGWVGNASFLSDEGVRFHVDYARCLRGEFGGGHPHFIGVWNEMSWTPDYVVALKRELVAAGLDTKVVVADGPSCGPGGGGPISNETLASSIYAIGQHYSCGHGDGCPGANENGLAFWVSEDFSVSGETYDGAAYWGSRLSLNWVLLNATATVAWALIWDAYPSFGYRGCGLMSAYTPWSGNYMIGDAIWMTAHHNQFMWPGWHLLQSLGNSSAGSSGVLPGGGSWVAARSPDGADFTLVVETLQATDSGYCAPWAPTSAQNMTFLLAPGTGLPGPGARLKYWQTVEGAAFVNLPDLVVAADGSVSFSMPHQAKVTISTVTTARKGGANASAAIPPDGPFPLPYSDSFDEADYAYDRQPRFLADTGGSFAVRHGAVQQVASSMSLANAWGGLRAESPVSVIGDAAWTNITASVSVSFNAGPADRGDAAPLPPPPPPPPAASDAPDVLARVEPCDPPGAVRPQQAWLYSRVGDGGYISNNAAAGPGGPVCLKTPRCDGDLQLTLGPCLFDWYRNTSECGAQQPGAPLPEFMFIIGSQDACQHKLLTRMADGQCGTVTSAEDGTITSQQCAEPDGPGLLWLYNSSGTLQLSVSNPVSGGAPLCLTAPAGGVAPRTAPVAYAGLALGPFSLLLRSDASFILRVRQGPVLAHGPLPGAPGGFNSTAWHRLTLSASGAAVTASVDGAVLASGVGAAPRFVPQGQVSLRSGYHYAAFDDLQIAPTAAAAGAGGALPLV